MNKINFNQTGGFPLSTNVLDEMQISYNIVNGVGAMAGTLAILSGCEEKGTTVTDGYVQIAGETYFFKGGIKQATVVIVEEFEAGEFENGQSKPIITRRYARFGSGITNYNWNDFKRVTPLGMLAETISAMQAEIKLLKLKTAPYEKDGGMTFWRKPANLIPEGWAEVIDWRGRMPVGLDPNDDDFNELEKTGGKKTHINTLEELAPHTHKGHVTEASGDWRGGGNNSAPNSTSNPGSTESAGEGQEYSIMNPYRIVMFIEWKGIQ